MSAVHRVDAPATSRAQFFERYGGTAPENYERFFVPAIGAPLAADLIDAAAVLALQAIDQGQTSLDRV